MKKILLHNIGLKITTFICAFIFWQLITGVADPVISETFRDIPVLVINEEIVTNQGKVYQIVDGSSVSVVIKGKTSIVREINKEDLIAVADFEALELSSLLPITVSVEGLNKGQVEASTTPTNLKVNIEDSTTKKFPITASTVGELSEGYVLGPMEVLTESVTISGPDSIVDKIVKVEARVNIDGINESGTLQSELVYYDENNLAVEQTLLNNELKEAVMVKYDIFETKVLPLELETYGSPIEGHYVVEILAEPHEVTVYGTSEDLEKYSVYSVNKKALDVSGLQGKVEMIIDLNNYLPEGLNLFTDTGTSVAVTIQIDELGTKSIEVPVQSITVHNNPAGLNMEYYGVTDVMLSFTGKSQVLDDLSIEDIRLSIDLNTLDATGEYDVLVNVTSIEGIKLLNEVKVPVKLTKN